MRKKGKKMEREKGLFNAFNFKNYKTISKKALNKLKLLHLQNNQNFQSNFINNVDLLSDDERKKDLHIKNTFSKFPNSEFQKKYLQFNGMNQLHKVSRHGSAHNFINIRNGEIISHEIEPFKFKFIFFN